MRKGLDVSEYQGAIDWVAVKQAAPDFVFIRALVGLRYDARVFENLSGAEAAGIPYGVYHVAHESVAGADQGEELIDFLSRHAAMPLPVMLDIERPMYAGSTPVHRDTLFNAQLIAAMLQEAGYCVGIYTGAWWWNPASQGVDVRWAEALDLWAAAYTTRPILPRGWTECRFWQYTNSGTFPGIRGAVDMNYFLGDWDNYVDSDAVSGVPEIRLHPGSYDLVRAGDVVARFIVMGESDDELPAPEPEAWVLPVGTAQYPALKWGVRGYTHDLRTTVENPNRRNGQPWPHTGYDINLDVHPYGDIERGLPVFSIAPGTVHYVTDAWSGVGMCVVCHEHEGAPLYVRYAHLDVHVSAGNVVAAGQVLGLIADFPNEGDHLHLDMGLDPFAREWIAASVRWVDPATILRAHIDPGLVDGMLRVGD